MLEQCAGDAMHVSWQLDHRTRGLSNTAVASSAKESVSLVLGLLRETSTGHELEFRSLLAMLVGVCQAFCRRQVVGSAEQRCIFVPAMVPFAWAQTQW